MSISAQIIDQRIRKLAEEHGAALAAQVNSGNDGHKLHSATFVFLTLRTVLDLTDEEAMDGIVDGSRDFGVDAIHLGPVQDGEVAVTLVQGKYTKDLDKAGNFPESGVEKMLQAIDVLFDPQVPVTLNPRLLATIEDVRSFIAEAPSRPSTPSSATTASLGRRRRNSSSMRPGSVIKSYQRRLMASIKRLWFNPTAHCCAMCERAARRTGRSRPPAVRNEAGR